jgi:hypothetical protein
MNKILLEKINQKIAETLSKKDEIHKIVHSLEKLAVDDNSFTYGIVIGRLYNSFYYQTKRILNREPTSEEFTEFLNILKEHESEFLKF